MSNIGFETEKVEFKKSTGELKEGIISLSSMLNKNGYGTLYFGVKNNGDMVGQSIGDSTLRDISQAIATNIKPQVIPTISIEYMNECNIIKVDARGDERPYSAYGRYYIRSADEDRELSPSALKNLMSVAKADAIIDIPASNQELTFNQLKTAYAMKNLTLSNETFEPNLGLRTQDGRYNLMAELLSDTNTVSIKVVTFKGNNKNEIIRRNEYGYKCLLVAMDQVLTYVEALNDTKVTMGSHQRQEEKLFDFACFKEAWQNACLHNCWAKENPPAVYIFNDRIEIISTGGLAPDVNKNEFYKGISRPVNPKLQKIFGQLGYVEQTGHGVPLIISTYGITAFDIMDNFINVTIPFSKTVLRDSTLVLDNRASLNQSQERVLKFITLYPTATIAQIVKELEMSDGYVRKILTFLKDNNYIKRVGGNRSGSWKIV